MADFGRMPNRILSAVPEIRVSDRRQPLELRGLAHSVGTGPLEAAGPEQEPAEQGAEEDGSPPGRLDVRLENNPIDLRLGATWEP